MYISIGYHKLIRVNIVNIKTSIGLGQWQNKTTKVYTRHIHTDDEIHINANKGAIHNFFFFKLHFHAVFSFSLATQWAYYPVSHRFQQVKCQNNQWLLSHIMWFNTPNLLISSPWLIFFLKSIKHEKLALYLLGFWLKKKNHWVSTKLD